ncbi:head maturation protease [Pseudomonas phage vB_PpuM-Aura]
MNVFEMIAQQNAAMKPIDVHKLVKGKDVDPKLKEMTTAKVGMPGLAQAITFAEWLPFAAKTYHCSPDPKDYILVPNIVMPSEIPNRNGVGFPLQQLVRFNPETGCQGFRTAVGKGTYADHQNNTVAPLAKGVIVDSFMRPLEGFKGGVWKLLFLLAYDRSKDQALTNAILAGTRTNYSMGAYLTKYTCSICGRDRGQCVHLSAQKGSVNFRKVGNQLAYSQAYEPIFFETSSVEDPAFVSSITGADHLLITR